MKFLLLVLLSIQIVFAFGQYQQRFTPSSFQDTIPSEVYSRLKKRLVEDKAKITTKGKQGNYIRSLHDRRFEYLVKSFNEGYFIVDHPLTTFLTKVASRIYDANPNLSQNVNIFAFNSSAPNAVSFGEGTICIMLGLLERLETEDQVAYILCHEFAHYYANHAEKNFADLAALNYDKELKHKIDDAVNSPYGRYSRLKALFNQIGLSVTYHSRKSEFEADSLGLVYYLKTGYDRRAPLRVMQILEQADKETFRHNIDFKKYFDFNDFPFKDSWTAYSKSNIVYGNANDEETDALKTHPNCKSRFGRLKRQLNNLIEPDTAQFHSDKTLKGLNQLASLEIINSHYYFKQYGKALFNSLLLADSFPDNPYPHAMIAKSLYQLHRAQKNHDLHTVLELPDPRFDENYDRFLTFINKLRLHELANIAYQYVTTRPAAFYTNEEFIHALWLCSKFDFSKIGPEKVARDYENLHPQGRYIREIQNNN